MLCDVDGVKINTFKIEHRYKLLLEPERFKLFPLAIDRGSQYTKVCLHCIPYAYVIRVQSYIGT